MNVRSNKIKDIRDFYLERLKKIYPGPEAKKLLEIILEELTGVSRMHLVTEPDLRVSESDLLKIHFACKDLLNYKPVQHITGMADFYGLRLRVNPYVLIPRPETEELVEWILNDLQQRPADSALDIGTGSGAIALALKKHHPEMEVTALDNSQNALHTARMNAEHNDLKVHFKYADIIKGVDPDDLLQYDIIVSNPPYVTEADKKEMQPNVLDYEPASALYVPDDDPLIFYRAILNFAKSHLLPGGKIYFEINERFGEEMIGLLEAFGYQNIHLKKDLNDRDRMIRGSKPSQN